MNLEVVFNQLPLPRGIHRDDPFSIYLLRRLISAIVQLVNRCNMGDTTITVIELDEVAPASNYGLSALLKPD